MKRRTFVGAILTSIFAPKEIVLAPTPPAVLATKTAKPRIQCLVVDMRVVYPDSQVKRMYVEAPITVGELLNEANKLREIRDKNEKFIVNKNRMRATTDDLVQDGDCIVVVSCKLRCCGPRKMFFSTRS